MAGPISVPLLSSEITFQIPSGQPGGIPASQLRSVLQDMNAQRAFIVTPQMYGAIGDGVADDTIPLQNALTFVGTNGGFLNLSNGTFRITSALTLSPTYPTAINNIAVIGPGIIKPDVSVSGDCFKITGGAGRPSIVGLYGIELNLTSCTALSSGVALVGTANAVVDGCSFKTDQTTSFAAGFSVITIRAAIPGNQDTNCFWTLIRGNNIAPLSGPSGLPPYGISMYGQTNATVIKENTFTNISVGIAGLPDPVDGNMSNSVEISSNFFENNGNDTAIEIIGNPASIGISSGSYNSGTGVVTLTTGTSTGISVGSIFSISGATGSGADIGLLDGFQAFTAIAGSSGTTIKFTVATGLMITSITGGSFAWYGFLTTGWTIHNNRAESVVNFFKIGSTGSSKSGDQPFPPTLRDNFLTGVTNYINNAFGNVVNSEEFHRGGLVGSNIITTGNEGMTYDIGGGTTGFNVKGNLTALGTAGYANTKMGNNSGIPSFIFDDGATIWNIDYPGGSQARFVYNAAIVVANWGVVGSGGQLSIQQVISNFDVTTPVAISALPSAVTYPGARAFVNNATQTVTANIGAVLSGTGANTIPVYSDGTNWRVG